MGTSLGGASHPRNFENGSKKRDYGRSFLRPPEKSLREVKPARGSSANIRGEIRSEPNPMRVKEAMTLGLIGVPETATLSQALDALLRGRISALFVFDASGEPAG